MRRTLKAILSSIVLSLAFASVAHAQTNAATAQARTASAPSELMQGTRAYNERKFAEAERRFRRALELDQTRKVIPLYIARAIRGQFKPDDASAENVATAERAIAAYQEIKDRGPQDEDFYEEAYKAIIAINVQLKREDRAVEVLTMRANDPFVSNERRAQAFVILASRKLRCAEEITERSESKTSEKERRASSSDDKAPPDAGDFIRARGCVDEGLQLIEQADSLLPNEEAILLHKANLLREASKLAEMEGNAELKEDYERQYEESLDTRKRTGAEAQRKSEQNGSRATVAPAAPPEPK